MKKLNSSGNVVVQAGIDWRKHKSMRIARRIVNRLINSYAPNPKFELGGTRHGNRELILPDNTRLAAPNVSLIDILKNVREA
jgi:hypothetical protein